MGGDKACTFYIVPRLFFHVQLRRMPSFRWPETWQDIALAKQVVSDRPTKPADWEVLANALNTIFSREGSEVSLKGRGCKRLHQSDLRLN